MASACPKPDDNQEIAEYMEYLSKRFYVKLQDQFVIPSTSSLPSKLADVEELFIYKFLCNISITSSVYFYISQERAHCLLIATADGNTITEEKFYTAACYPAADLKSFTIEQIIQTRTIEIILCLKDLLSNEHNYGWLHPSKKLSVIDFSIKKNETMEANLTLPSLMLPEKMKTRGRLSIDSLKTTFHSSGLSEKKSIACRAIESLVDSFVEAIDPTRESSNDFICTNSYAFDGGMQMATLKLIKIVERTRSRWNELVTHLKIQK